MMLLARHNLRDLVRGDRLRWYIKTWSCFPDTNLWLFSSE